MCMSPRQSCSGVMGIQVIDIGRQQLTSVRGDPDVGSSGQPGQGRDRGARWSRVSSALQSWLPAWAAVVPSSLALCRGARRHMLRILLYPLFFPLHSCAVSGPGSHAHGATAPRAQPPRGVAQGRGVSASPSSRACVRLPAGPCVSSWGLDPAALLARRDVRSRAPLWPLLPGPCPLSVPAWPPASRPALRVVPALSCLGLHLESATRESCVAMFTCAHVSFTRSWPAMAAAALLTAIRGPDHAAWRTPPAFPREARLCRGSRLPAPRVARPLSAQVTAAISTAGPFWAGPGRTGLQTNTTFQCE